MATGEIAGPTFEWLLTSGHEITGVVTQPDKPVGRKQVMSSPQMKLTAERAGLSVIQPEKVGAEESLKQIRQWEPEVIVVMAYGQILPQALLEIPEVAIINLHASLLPKYRGAACIQAPLREGDRESGWSVIYVEKKLDAGNVIHRLVTPIRPGETGGELHDRLAELAPEALQQALERLEVTPSLAGEAQDEDAVTYVPKLSRQDGKLDWKKSAEELERLVRAYDPWPGTFTTLEGRRLKIFPPTVVIEGSGVPGTCRIDEQGVTVYTGEGALLLSDLQADGKKRMTARDYAHGRAESLTKGFGLSKS